MLPLLIGAALLIGGTLVVLYWEDVKDWITKLVNDLKVIWPRLKPHVPYAVAVYGDLILDGLDTLISIMHKIYYQEDGTWVEETTTRKIKSSEVPEHIRKKIEAQRSATDITDDIERELELTI